MTEMILTHFRKEPLEITHLTKTRFESQKKRLVVCKRRYFSQSFNENRDIPSTFHRKFEITDWCAKL